MGPEETSYNYYDKPQRSYFSLSVYYKNEEDVLVTKFFDCISNNLSKNTWWVQEAMNFIFVLPEWQMLNISKVYFWMDNGPVHFRTYEFQHFLWSLHTTKLFHFECEWNYFIEGHGKSICDTHFSKVSQALKSQSKETEIKGSEDAINAIRKMFTIWKQQAIQ